MQVAFEGHRHCGGDTADNSAGAGGGTLLCNQMGCVVRKAKIEELSRLVNEVGTFENDGDQAHAFAGR